ncbi:aminoglycoside phosphotransferase family protein [Solimonas terrae]|uniref:aminoglycoside phosphotransferase family protein n=1 Tax=Solimonas terrae TaxID=1396819 RepID=UPI0018853E01|nr:phosphotransferase [Solimonas terrae]
MKSTDDLDARAVAARDWALRQLDLAAAAFAPASADASFRRYFRIEDGQRSWVLMDAPPEREDCRPFLQVAQLLHDAGLHAPRVIAQDLACGFLLLGDLGRHTYLHVINDANADALMSDAIDALIRWQLASRPGVLPRYDEALLQRELALFPDWYVGRHLERALSATQAATLSAIDATLIASALEQPRVYVHRDYMPRNLMLSTPNPGILDFQDAVEGPLAYDVVSLFKDAFLSWPSERIEVWRRQYADRARRAGLPLPDEATFVRQFDWMGVQRHLKVIGIFARINYRDGKPHYLGDVPRFIGYVREVVSCYRELTPLLRLFDELGMVA